VTKVHLEAVRFARQGYTIILIGHSGHDEVIGTLGEAPESTVLVSSVQDVDKLQVKDPAKMAYLTQTTLSLDETRDIVERLKERFRPSKDQKPRILLCNGEPAAGRQSGGTANGCLAGRRIAE